MNGNRSECIALIAMLLDRDMPLHEIAYRVACEGSAIAVRIATRVQRSFGSGMRNSAHE